MKTSITLLACLLFNSITYSQKFSLSVQNDFQTVYKGVENRITCTIEGVSCKSILLKTDNGTITQVGPCNYIYRPSRVSNSKITILKKVNNKYVKVGEEAIAIRDFPDPVAVVGGINGGTINKEFLKAQQGLGAYLIPSLGFDLRFTVKSFFITVIRNKELFFFTTIEGYLFSNEIKEQFSKLQKDDVVAFTSVVVYKPGGTEGRAKGNEYIIE